MARLARMDSPHDRQTLSFDFETQGGQQPAVLTLSRSARAPIVLVLPALGLRAEYYAPLVAQLAANGVHAAAIDFPGHGVSPVRASRRVNWGYPELVAHAAAARQAASRALPDVPVFWLGHSIGGQVALLESGLHPDGAAGVALVASGSPYVGAWRGLAALKIAVGTRFSAALASVVGHFPGEQAGFAGREARGVMQQWARLARTGAYRFGAFDGDALLAAGRAPVLALRIEGDDLAPEAAVEHTLAKLGQRPIERQLWQGLPRANVHNRWPRSPEPAAERVTSFVRATVAASVESPVRSERTSNGHGRASA